MKKNILFYALLVLFVFSCTSDSNSDGSNMDDDTPPAPATTQIPDAAFEQALIDLSFDDEIDGEVLNSQIQVVVNLNVDDKGITDLTGIKNFTKLENLSVRNNQLTNLDVSSMNTIKFIWAEDNALESLNLGGLTILEKVGADRNALVTLSVTENQALQFLTLSSNELVSIDVTTNNALTDFTVVDNPLNCILVNQNQLNDIPVDWSKDEEDSYALDCE